MSNSGLIGDFWGTFLMQRSQIFIAVLILSKGREQVVGSIHWFSYISPELHHTFLVYAKIVRNLSHSEQRKCVDARDACPCSIQECKLPVEQVCFHLVMVMFSTSIQRNS